ncbi:MAG: hemolysin activation/secretion protein [Gammaproteobacteria bacterium]
MNLCFGKAILSLGLIKEKSNLALIVVFVLSQLSVVALAADLPAGTTAGGAQPILDDVIAEPFVYPNVSPEQPSTESTTQTLIDTDAPRMQVRGFRIKGITEHSDLEITQQAIELLVKTEAEKLAAVSPKPGFTIDMFESITTAIGRYYRERGFFLARAFIPEQQVSNGIVAISVVEGFLDQIVYRGNSLYSEAQLENIFGSLRSESVFLEDVETAVFIANDLPGLDANLLFGPGLKPGSAAIQINSVETPSSGYLSWDNYGSFFTGEDRLRGAYGLSNLFGQADQLDLDMVMTFNPQNSIYLGGRYEQPLWGYDTLVGGGFSFNDFDVGGNLADLGINGKSTILNGHFTWLYTRKRTVKIRFTGSVSLKNAKSKIINTVTSKDKLTVLSATAAYEGTSWSSSGSYQQMGVTLSLGIPDFLGSMGTDGDGLSGRLGGSESLAGGDFTKISFNYLRLQRLADLQTLTLKFSGQVSSDLLTSTEQFSLGGPDTVRAYPVAETLMDTAWLANIEWRVDASPEIPREMLNNLQLVAFFDYGTGDLNDPLTNDVATVIYSGYGFGAEMEPYKAFHLKVEMAFDLGDTPSDNRTYPFFFSARYDF